ncbi:hypothetical protein TRFO_37094 [Tritrichomonas foetus]|uniref:Uncharacterized protein n=1 Tax=Tritrichomonas foetus TaxID=1144522 RepID=A0A1J4JGW8_9EUKA|nr:hypothetical protein TRFO_37094 [Tritrichomonas foetus]|eukprot:OHS96717.1 hypothetical protein TRFO_37094 [Tritrichomonas foetus]
MTQSSSTLSFGFQPKSTITFGTGNVGAIYQINKHEDIVTTSKEICKIENSSIKTSFPSNFATSLFIPEANLIVAVTVQKSLLFVFPLHDMKNPIVQNFETDQVGVFHLVYSQKSSVLLTFGSGVKIWNFDLIIPDRRRSALIPKVTISLRHNFIDVPYETALLFKPAFDYSEELVFLPTSKGIIGYNMDGKSVVSMSLFPANSKTAHFYLEKKKRLLVYDDENGLNFCSTKGFVHTRFSIGSATMIWMDYLDTENAVLMNNKGNFYILNLKTGKSFNCYFTSKMPTRIILMKESREICLCFGPQVQTFNVIIPWTLWSINITKTNLLRRIERKGEAARVIAFTSNSFVKFFSPKDGKVLTAATPTSPSSPIFCFYDRGYMIFYEGKQKRIVDTGSNERLFLVLEDGHIVTFDASKNPCQQQLNINFKAVCMTFCYFQNEFYYAIASQHGEILIIDKNSLQMKKKFNISNDVFCGMIFDPISKCLICIMSRETILFDLKTKNIISRLLIKGTKLVELNNQLLYYGYENGDISMVKISEENNTKSLSIQSNDIQGLHNDCITGFAFSKEFWISVSKDMTVRYWNYSNGNFYTINLPARLYGCEIINGNRDVVVGTENELMLINGKQVFDGEIDEADELIDNFDKEEDELMKEVIEKCRSQRKAEEEKEQKKKEENEERERQKQIHLEQLKKQNKVNKRKRINLSQEALDILQRLKNQSNPDTPLSKSAIQLVQNHEESKQQAHKEDEELHRKQAIEAMMKVTNNVNVPKVVFKKPKTDTENETPNSSMTISETNNEISRSSSSARSIDSSNCSSTRSERSESIQKSSRRSSKQMNVNEFINNNFNNEDSKNDEGVKIHISRPDSISKSAPRRKKKKSSSKKSSYIENMENTNDSQTQTSYNSRPGSKYMSLINKIASPEEYQQKIENKAEIKETTSSHDSPFTTQKDQQCHPEAENFHLDNSETNDNNNNQHNSSEMNKSHVFQPNEPATINNTPKRTRPPPVKILTNPRPIKNKNITDNNNANDASQPTTITTPSSSYASIATSPRLRRDGQNNLRNSSGSLLQKNSINNTSLRASKVPQRAPTPPPIIKRITTAKLQKHKRKNSTPVSRRNHRFFEMPQPLIVLDYDAVVEQYGRGKIELLPLMKRIDYEKNVSSFSSHLNSMIFTNNQTKYESSILPNSAAKNLHNSIHNNSPIHSLIPELRQPPEQIPPIGRSFARPLIEQSKCQIFVPTNESPKGNNNKMRSSYKKLPSTSRRPLGNLENSITVMNPLYLTPRQLIPKRQKNKNYPHTNTNRYK